MQVAKKLINDRLFPLYCKQEIESISRLIFEKICGFSGLRLHLKQNETISAANLAQITDIINRLLQFEPIQYIFGETEFYGLIFKVNPGVLIPRPETEELVEWMINDYKQLAPTILDIGTGSGCIPIALLKNLPGASAVGWDISSEALAVAKENAKINHVDIDFQYVDILKTIYPAHKEAFDVIVSNPPYVTTSDRKLMHKNVIEWEPHIALFVPDNDALVFYRAIADVALHLLKSGGNLFLEINEKYGKEVSALLELKGFSNLILRKDINGKERMIKAELK